MNINKYLLISTIFFSLPFIDISAQAPAVRCLSVLPDGSVSITWTQPADSCGSFAGYEIYSAQNLAGPYSLLATIPSFSTTTWVHAGANANLNAVYYFMVNNSSCPSNVSDTVSTIFLTLQNVNNGTNQLSWNSTGISSVYNKYYIYREYPPGNIILVDSLMPGFSYTDNFSVCWNDTVKYFIQLQDSSGCFNISNTAIQTNDVLQPPPVTIDSVSVDPVADDAMVSWNAGSAGDISGYIIYIADALGGWDSIDFVPGSGSTFYLNPASFPSGSSESYAVAVVDNCGNTSAISGGHGTIFLSASIDKCTASATLNWTAYYGWTGVTPFYDLWYIVSGNYYYLGSTTSTTFAHTGLVKGTTYCYYIRASDGNGRTSTSNDVCITADVTRIATFNYINAVTVQSNGEVFLSCYTDSAADVDYYKIQRSTDTINFTILKTLSGVSVNSRITFIDKEALTSTESYYYRIVIVDSCGNESSVSNFGRTILLRAEAKSDIANLLTWNRYRTWLSADYSYSVYREVDGAWDSNPVSASASSSDPDTTTDDVYQFIDGRGQFCYYVQANQLPVVNPYPSGPAMFSDVSLSNVVCIEQIPKVLVPNTFTPNDDGLNDIFMPQRAFIDVSDYLFIIYNRFGQEIFTTTDPDQGWDGTYNSRHIPIGAYVYYFRFKVGDGRVVEKSGTITVLR